MGKVFLIGGLLSFLGLWINLKPVGLGFLYGLIALVSGIIFSIIFCALYEILDYLEKIYERCSKIEDKPITKIKCEHCGKSYDSDYTLCPFCGSKKE